MSFDELLLLHSVDYCVDVFLFDGLYHIEKTLVYCQIF